MPWKHIGAVEVQLSSFVTWALDTGGQLNAPVALSPLNRSMDGSLGCYGRSKDKSLDPTGSRTPDRPARSLQLPNYPGSSLADQVVIQYHPLNRRCVDY